MSLPEQVMEEQFVKYCLEGDAAGARKLLSVVDPRGCNVLLHKVVALGHVGVAALLLKAGLDVDSLFEGFTPLHFAAKSGEADAAKLLLRCGANIEARISPHGLTALGIATCPEVVQALVEAGADVQAVADGYSCLTSAVFHGQGAKVGILLGGGADPDSCENGGTPLHVAVLVRNVEMVDRLLRAGADPDGCLRVSTEPPPTVLAAEQGDTEIVSRLVGAGATLPMRACSCEKDSAFNATVKRAGRACAGCGARGVPLRKCSGCLGVRYCGGACQNEHWPRHKRACAKFALARSVLK